MALRFSQSFTRRVKRSSAGKSGLENEIFLVSRNFFSLILILKIAVKMNLKLITKNRAADPKKGFSQNRFQSRMAARWPCR